MTVCYSIIFKKLIIFI